MKLNKFKKRDRVKVVRYGANASDFNDPHTLGVYRLKNWQQRTFLIEGTIKLTNFPDTSPTAHLLTTLGGEVAGYVYSEDIDFATAEWSYSLSTNTIWFDKDHGRVEAKTYDEAKSLAEMQLAHDIQEMNRRMGGFATISINLDEISIEQIPATI